MATSKAADRGEGKSLSYIVLASLEKGVFDSRTSYMLNLDQERLCKYF